MERDRDLPVEPFLELGETTEVIEMAMGEEDIIDGIQVSLQEPRIMKEAC